MSNELVIYHGSCYDGFTAAWIARQSMPECELLPAKYGDPPPEVTGLHVYVVDFSYPREAMVEMKSKARTLTVLDHHKTAKEACEGLEFCTFDMERSGCGMAWDHFSLGGHRPDWINRVEDRDLWRFAFNDTPEVHAYIASLSMTMGNWDLLNRLSIDEIGNRGRSVLAYIRTYIKKASAEARIVYIDDVRVVAINIPYQNASETADYLLKKHVHARYSMGYFQRADGRWQYSLRSRTDFDVSEVAKSYGGGGHAQAAGFETAELLPELACATGGAGE